MKRVVIVVPYHLEKLGPDEETSLRHLEHYLCQHDIIVLFPKYKTVPQQLRKFQIIKLEPVHFSSIEDYALYLTSLPFYDHFTEYEYLLIYQLDALVFSDQLLAWCDKGYDYVGAPWYQEVWKKMGFTPFPYDAVGNSGFSLRKISACRQILMAYNRPQNIFRQEIAALLRVIKHGVKDALRIFRNPQTVNQFFTTNYYKKQRNKFHVRGTEDIFWAFRGREYFPSFNIPRADIAVDFSFETSPRFCLEKNNGKLPFGCHGWNKLDREFWEPYLLRK